MGASGGGHGLLVFMASPASFLGLQSMLTEELNGMELADAHFLFRINPRHVQRFAQGIEGIAHQEGLCVVG